MNYIGGTHQTWSPTRLEEIRSGLIDGYHRIADWGARHLADFTGSLGDSIVDGALAAVTHARPTWVPSSIADELTGRRLPRCTTGDITEAGESGLVVFESPVARTTLGDAQPFGTAAVEGLLWWCADFDGHAFAVPTGDEPDALLVHPLSQNLCSDAPWGARVWESSPLTDLGMFLIPWLADPRPPEHSRDDLAPAVRLLLGLGTAVAEGRVIFSDVGGGGSPARLPQPRTASVLLAA